MYRKILLAYDGSAFSAAVLRQGAELAGLCNAELHLLSIVDTSGAMAVTEALGPGDVWGQEEETLKQMIKDNVQDLRDRGLTVKTSVRFGNPAAEILSYVRETGIDLVVLGHTSKGMLARCFQGSVGAKLLNHLSCSLLVATAG